MKNFTIRALERIFKCRIYRHSLPRGTDIFLDVQKNFGTANIKTVFDIGANTGQSAVTYRNAFPSAEIYSFEPVSSSFQELDSNTRSLERVKAFHFGFGDATTKLEINIHENSRTNSIVSGQSATKEDIMIRRVDDFVVEHAIRYIDFMKIDTEGYEIEVLKGAEQTLRERKIRILYIESEPCRTDQPFTPFNDLMMLLSGYGYELFGIYEQQPHWSGEKSILFFNPVFISKELVDRGVSPTTYPLNQP